MMMVLVGRKLVRSLVVLVAASIIVFLAVVTLPGDAVEFRTQGRATDQDLAELRQQEGLDRGVPAQYGQWVVGIAQQDLGDSLVSGRSVSALIAERLDVSIALTIMSMGIAIPSMLALAWLAADGPVGVRWVGSTLAVGGAAVPVVAAGIILISLFSWLSNGKLGSVVVLTAGVSVWQQLHLLVLPSLVLGLPSACYGAGILRGPWADASVHPSAADAHIRGLAWWLVTRRYVLPRIAPVVFRVAAVLTGAVLGGAAIVETMFGISGIGALLVSAVESRDQPIVLAIAMLSAAVVIFGFTLADIAGEVWRR